MHLSLFVFRKEILLWNMNKSSTYYSNFDAGYSKWWNTFLSRQLMARKLHAMIVVVSNTGIEALLLREKLTFFM